jgi:ribulose-phosphate 3-epimerase
LIGSADPIEFAQDWRVVSSSWYCPLETMPRPAILPSILSADYADAKRDILDALTHCRAGNLGGDVIHIDVMDGHLVPNISFGPPVIAKLRAALPGVFFDVHLMIDEPVRYAEPHRKAGADLITFHVEAPEVRGDLAGACNAIRATGAKVGVTLKPKTPIDEVLAVADHVDLVLIMSVEPGFGGQKFMVDQLDKCRVVRSRLRPEQILEIDGGMNADTLPLARAAGVDWFVVGSALFDADDRGSFVKQVVSRLP